MYSLKTTFMTFLTAYMSYSYAMEPCNEPKATCKTAEDCIVLLDQLDNQPLFNGSGSVWSKECKVLPLKHWYDCLMIEILCINAEKKLGRQQAWHVRNFGAGDNILRDKNGKNLGEGITEWLHKDYIPTRCSLEKLKHVFDDLVKQMTTNWIQTTLNEYPDILHTKSEEEWSLFIKPEVLFKEADLIIIFASAFNIYNDKDVSCDDHWKKPSGDFELRDTLYLWIKKKSYDKVIKALNLQINSNC